VPSVELAVGCSCLRTMDPIRNIKLRWLHGTLGDVTYQVTRVQLWRGCAHKWQPAINAFRCESAVRICVDLAGVDKSLIELTVESRRIIVRGSRETPEPAGKDERAVQVLALEIDYGPFEREVELPAEIDVGAASAEHENGLLWIDLPLKK
jgi:HSP20 family molecular chaperone IbpA